RLVLFWSDHFSVSGPSLRERTMIPDMINGAIRSTVATSFPAMLRAVITHPAMLQYLDQSMSVGPNSEAGQAKKRGLNENLAREVLELHTLGVDAAYTQADVREFAELLTGMTFDADGFRFRPRMAEPGAETVLGTRYGRGKATLGTVEKALRDLALRPETAAHLAGKLITHFVGGPPNPGHLDQVATAYLENDGALMPVYAALLDHPAAWRGEFQKVKTPFEFIVAGFRAYGIPHKTLRQMEPRVLTRLVMRPMAAMGQPYLSASGPDGWSEDPADWITAPGLAERILWAQMMAARFGDGVEPAAFLARTLPGVASRALQRAVRRAETREDALALVLASPEFNRR
ncbi:MAG: DUF1800 domain-containing protein, partial [Pseudomonadota bacterium]